LNECLLVRNMIASISFIHHLTQMRNPYHLQARQTEASLQLLRRGIRQRGAGAADTSDNISDNLSDKICAQLFLDVQVQYSQSYLLESKLLEHLRVLSYASFIRATRFVVFKKAKKELGSQPEAYYVTSLSVLYK